MADKTTILIKGKSCSVDGQPEEEICAEIDITNLIESEDITIPELSSPVIPSISIDDLIKKSEDIYNKRFELVKNSLEEQWENDRITGNELATSLIQASVQLNSSSLTDLINAKNLEVSLIEKSFKLELEKLQSLIDIEKFELEAKKIRADIIIALKKIESEDARTLLYKEQAKGFRDQTKLNSLKIIQGMWSTIYTQNQLTQVPLFVEKPQLEKSIQKWFLELGMEDPL